MRHHLVSVLMLAATWGVAFVTVLATGVQGSAREATIGLLCGGGLVASLVLRSVMASYVLAGVLAFLLAEIGAHAIWGPGSVQGGPTHLAVLAAASLGAAGSAVVSWAAAKQTASSVR